MLLEGQGPAKVACSWDEGAALEAKVLEGVLADVLDTASLSAGGRFAAQRQVDFGHGLAGWAGFKMTLQVYLLVRGERVFSEQPIFKRPVIHG